MKTRRIFAGLPHMVYVRTSGNPLWQWRWSGISNRTCQCSKTCKNIKGRKEGWSIWFVSTKHIFYATSLLWDVRWVKPGCPPQWPVSSWSLWDQIHFNRFLAEEYQVASSKHVSGWPRYHLRISQRGNGWFRRLTQLRLLIIACRWKGLFCVSEDRNKDRNMTIEG